MIRRALVLLLVVIVPGAAAASPLSVYGFDPRAIAMGGAQTAAADDATATFYNPALLTRQTRVTFGFGINYVKPQLFVKPQAMSFSKEDKPLLMTDFTQWSLGILFPLGGKVKNRIALGIGISLPGGYLVRVHSVDAAQPYFYLFESSAQKMVLLPAFAVKITDWLSAGAGLQILANLGGTTDVRLDLFTQRVLRRQMQIQLTTTEALTAGLAFGPFKGLTVGLSFRQEMGLDYQVPANIELKDVGTLDLQLHGTAVWSPHEISLGASWAIPHAHTTVSFDMNYSMWSLAPSPQVMVELNASGALISGFGLDRALSLCSDRIQTDSQGRTVCEPVSPGFVDALSPRIGIEHSLNENVTIRAGYWYRPTPVPNQVGRTNYLDSSTHNVSIGAGFTFKDPLDIFSRPVTFDIAFDTAFLQPRSVDKGSDGTVDYTFGGNMFQVAAALRYQF